MTTFHPGTTIVKSRNNAFDIPPKRAENVFTPRPKKPPNPSKAQQAARSLETPQERAARLAAKVTAYRPESLASYPSATAESIAQAVAKTAKLRRKSL